MWINLAVVCAYGNNDPDAQIALRRALALNATHPAVVHNNRVLMGNVQGVQPILDLYIPLPGRR